VCSASHAAKGHEGSLRLAAGQKREQAGDFFAGGADRGRGVVAVLASGIASVRAAQGGGYGGGGAASRSRLAGQSAGSG